MRTLIAGLIAIMGCAPSYAEDNPLQSYKNCIVRNALRLAKGSDAADLIAKFASASCGSERKEAEAFLTNPNNDFVRRNAIIEAAEGQAVYVATVQILEFRIK